MACMHGMHAHGRNQSPHDQCRVALDTRAYNVHVDSLYDEVLELELEVFATAGCPKASRVL